jgi:hypothetical protein
LRDNKKVQSADPRLVPIITIKGSAEVKGTYFNPLLISEVLAWICPQLKKMIFDIFEDVVIR